MLRKRNKTKHKIQKFFYNQPKQFHLANSDFLLFPESRNFPQLPTTFSCFFPQVPVNFPASPCNFSRNFPANSRKYPRKVSGFSGKHLFPVERHIYEIDKQEYNRILTNSITNNYKNTDNNTKHLINKTGKAILKDHHIIDRVDIKGENNCFITLKDHKENFENNPSTRLINPAKNELGRISKAILEKVNKQLQTSLNLNQWKSTSNVIEWFTNIEEKHKHKFMMFDVKDFYPSITEKLLHNAIKFAEKTLSISQKDKEIIYHSHESLLFNRNESWVKKGDKLFDVIMGVYDSAEVCKIVGCFILASIPTYKKDNIGLYRDD